MSLRDVRLNQLLRVCIDGVPLDLANSLIPIRSRFKPSLAMHIRLHAKSQKRYAGKTVAKGTGKVSRLALRGLVDSLESAVRSLKWQPKDTERAAYYDETTYSSGSFDRKRELVALLLDEINLKTALGLGANTGLFSRLAGDRKVQTISCDIDPAAVEIDYLECVRTGETHLLPLCVDLANTSPHMGWDNRERMSFLPRRRADAVMAFALTHHLAKSNNPPRKLAAFFGRLCDDALTIEFVPKPILSS
jgi:hypothetical protein